MQNEQLLSLMIIIYSLLSRALRMVNNTNPALSSPACQVIKVNGYTFRESSTVIFSSFAFHIKVTLMAQICFSRSEFFQGATIQGIKQEIVSLLLNCRKKILRCTHTPSRLQSNPSPLFLEIYIFVCLVVFVSMKPY